MKKSSYKNSLVYLVFACAFVGCNQQKSEPIKTESPVTQVKKNDDYYKKSLKTSKANLMSVINREIQRFGDVEEVIIKNNVELVSKSKKLSDLRSLYAKFSSNELISKSYMTKLEGDIEDRKLSIKVLEEKIILLTKMRDNQNVIKN